MRSCVQQKCICRETWGKEMSWCKLRLKDGIDTSDIPEADEEWFKKAKIVAPGGK